MNRKKVILSILMMVFLIAVGFVLPHLFKEKRGEKPASSAPTKEETTDTEQSSSKTALTFLDFSALQNFFSKGQIETLCQELQTYLTDTGNTSISSFVSSVSRHIKLLTRSGRTTFSLNQMHTVGLPTSFV